jgi:hypothetical protein
MALSDIYAPAAQDEDTLKKRRELASRLWKARESGMTPEDAMRSETGVDINHLNNTVDTKFGTGLQESEIAGFVDRLYRGKYDQNNTNESVFDRQEREARERSTASGAFGGPNWRGQSSEAQPETPRLDRLAQMQNEPIGSRPMSSSRRLIGSPASQMRRINNKAIRARIDPSKYSVDELKGMGFSAGGIRSHEEGERRREQERINRMALIKQQEEERRREEERQKEEAESRRKL